jgi:very-short-patch-repair endonuclease
MKREYQIGDRRVWAVWPEAERDQETLELLKKSLEQFGKAVYRPIVDYDGEILSGRHRIEAGCKDFYLVDTREMAAKLGLPASLVKLMVISHTNIQRPIKEEELRRIVNEAARILAEECGVEKGRLAETIAEKIVPRSPRRILELLDAKYKVEEKAEAGKKGAATVAAKTTGEEAKPNEKAEEKTKEQTDSTKLSLAKPREAPRASDFRRATYTEAEQVLAAELARRGVRYLTQIPYVREGEFTAEGAPKTYVADIVVADKLILEVEGEGSSSESVERDRFFEEKGLKVIHIPNEAALKYSNIIAEIIAFFTR